MAQLFADSIGGIGQLLANQQAQRDQESARSLAAVMNMQARQQQQRQFEAQQQMQQAAMEQSARENALARAFNLRRMQEYEIPSMQMRRDVPDEKAKIEARNFRLQALADQAGETGDFDPNDPALKAAPPEFGQTIAEVALRRRVELKPELDRRRQALSLYQQANRMDKVAAGIEGNPNPNSKPKWYQALSPLTMLFGGAPTSLSGEGMINPAAQAAEMKAKAEAMRRGLPPGLMEQFASNQDLTTGRAATGGFPKWYLETLPEGNALRGKSQPAGGSGRVVRPMNTPAGKSNTTLRVLDRESGVKLLELANGDVQKAADLADWLGFGDPVE